MRLSQPPTSYDNRQTPRHSSPMLAVDDGRRLEHELAPTPNPFSALAELAQSPLDTTPDSSSVSTPARSAKRRGKRSGKRRRFRQTAPRYERSQAEDLEELCKNMAAMCLDDDKPEPLPQKFFQDCRPSTPKEIPLIPIESVRHHWAPQFLSNVSPVQASSTLGFDETRPPQSRGSQSFTRIGSRSQFNTATEETSKVTYDSPRNFPLSAFLASLAFSDPVGCNSVLTTSEPPLKKRKLPHAVSTISQQIQGQGAIITTAPTLPRFSFEPPSPTCVSASSSRASPTASQMKLTSGDTISQLPLDPYPPLTKSSAQSRKEVSNSITMFKGSRITPLISPWRQPAISKALNPTLIPPSRLSKEELTIFSPSLRSTGGLPGFFDMGHSRQCWCSKHNIKAEPIASSKSTKDVPLGSSLEKGASLMVTQPQKPELEPEIEFNQPSEPKSTTIEMESEIDFDTDSETHSRTSDLESEDWCDFRDSIHPAATLEDDWALISPITPYDELSSASSTTSASDASTDISTAPLPVYKGLTTVLLSSSPPLTPNHSSESTVHATLSDIDDEDTPDSWMMNAVCFSQDQECVTCLQCECICSSASASAVEWPSLQESRDLIRRGRVDRMW